MTRNHAAVLVAAERAAVAAAEAVGGEVALAELPLDLNEVAPGTWQVVVYFEDSPSRGQRAALARAAAAARDDPIPTFAIAALPDTDWVAKSLAGLKPVRAGRFLVHGRHDRDRRRPNDLAIEIEAGQAFGTGHHGTTAGCLRAIDALAKQRRFGNLLDIGTGSGVLAVALAKIFKAPVLASDIDPIAVKVARENARANGVRAYVRTLTAAGLARGIFRARGPFDLIVANILAGPLVTLAPAVARRLTRDGVVVLSGLLSAQRARIVSAYRAQGLALRRAAVLEGWLTLVFAGRPLRTESRIGRRAPARPDPIRRSRAWRRPTAGIGSRRRAAPAADGR